MIEVWQSSKGVGPAFRDLHRALRGKPTWKAADAHTALGDKYTMEQITSTIGNMTVGRHVIRVSRGLYRFRGVV
jgi:hypothetical protein